MAASLERLLEEQREKERLQSELEIAQEVQANLFPHGHVSLPMLELHGACYPARTVSGDYYDFLTLRRPRPRAGAGRHQRQGHLRGVADGHAAFGGARLSLRRLKS